MAPSDGQDRPASLFEGLLRLLHELVETLLPALVIVLAVNLLLAQPRTVHGQSMEPSLHENERLIIDLLSYRFRAPQRGEIVVITMADRRGDPVIKRIIALPGETIEIRRGNVHINGEPIDEPYITQLTTGSLEPLLVPEEHLFVLGDNRGASNDSRYFGVVPYDRVLGRAWLRYWPPSDIGPFH